MGSAHLTTLRGRYPEGGAPNLSYEAPLAVIEFNHRCRYEVISGLDRTVADERTFRAGPEQEFTCLLRPAPLPLRRTDIAGLHLGRQDSHQHGQ